MTSKSRQKNNSPAHQRSFVVSGACPCASTPKPGTTSALRDACLPALCLACAWAGDVQHNDRAGSAATSNMLAKCSAHIASTEEAIGWPGFLQGYCCPQGQREPRGAEEPSLRRQARALPLLGVMDSHGRSITAQVPLSKQTWRCKRPHCRQQVNSRWRRRGAHRRARAHDHKAKSLAPCPPSCVVQWISVPGSFL